MKCPHCGTEDENDIWFHDIDRTGQCVICGIRHAFEFLECQKCWTKFDHEGKTIYYDIPTVQEGIPVITGNRRLHLATIRDYDSPIRRVSMSEAFDEWVAKHQYAEIVSVQGVWAELVIIYRE